MMFFYFRGEGSSNAPESSSQPSVIPSQDSLIGDLLSMDINPPQMVQPASQTSYPTVDLLGGGLDALVNIFLMDCFLRLSFHKTI